MVIRPASAAWQQNGLDVDPQPLWQTSECVAPDGAGGMIVAWLDTRDGRSHLYAQHLDAYGERLWATNGIAVAAPFDFEIIDCAIAPDGEGGAYLAWVVLDVSEYWISGQHLRGDGVLMWPADGLAIGASMAHVNEIELAATDDGGAMASWAYYDWDLVDVDIAAMKLVPEGTAWPIGGTVVSDAAGDQRQVTIVPRGGGGAFFVYSDTQIDIFGDVYAHALSAAGAADWLGGVPIGLATGAANQIYPVACSDGQGGFFAAWQDDRNGAYYDIYGVRVSASGVVYGAANGTPICAEPGPKDGPQIASGESGAFVAWNDLRNGSIDVYCQLLTPLMLFVFPVDGIPVGDLPSNAATVGVVADGAGGAIVVFKDDRSDSSYDLYAQRIDASGARYWNSDGVVLAREDGNEVWTALTSDGAGGLLAAWYNYGQPSRGAAAQRIERNGYWGYPAPGIASANDIPGDQGGRLLLAWDASRLDPWPAEEIDRYSLWRAFPGAPPGRLPDADWLARTLVPAAGDLPPLRGEAGGDRDLYWELVEVVDAYGLPGYARTVPTWYDSTGVDPAEHAFQVIAHGVGNAYWISPTATGHSVDNLAPAEPLNLAGQADYAPQGLALTWSPNDEADLANYAVYRGTHPDFPADTSTLIATPTDSTCFDAEWSEEAGYWYKVAAADLHGNLSAFALLGPQEVTGAADAGSPALTRLLPATPNPFNPKTSLRFDLARAGRVSMRVYDARGRLLRTLLDAERPAGQHELVWDGRTDTGGAVASGVFLIRFAGDGRRESQRVTLLK